MCEKVTNNKIAVIVLNYFAIQDTMNCINSVRKTLYSKIFLVDNSAELNEKEKLLDIFQKEEDIQMFFPDENMGFAAGANLAITEAVKRDFKWFLLLNNDAVLLDGAQMQLIKAYNQWPSTLIAPTIKWDKRINKGNYYHKYLGLIVNTWIPESNVWFYYITGCALAFDLSFLNTVGYLDDKFFMYGEDIELSFRAKEKGVPIILIEKELVSHKGSHSAMIGSFFYEYHMARMHYLLCFILFKNPLKKILSIMMKTFILTIRAAIRSVRHKSIAPLIALILSPLPLKIRPKRRWMRKTIVFKS